MCQASKKLGASHKESSLSCHVTLRTEPYLENRRRRPISVDSLRDAKTDLPAKEDSPEAQPGFSSQNGDSRWETRP